MFGIFMITIKAVVINFVFIQVVGYSDCNLFEYMQSAGIVKILAFQNFYLL